jgi:hypothetical protein
MGTLGISEGVVKVPHACPSTVYVIDVGVHTTPHVCHCVMSMVSCDCACALVVEVAAQMLVADVELVWPPVSLKSISGGHP